MNSLLILLLFCPLVFSEESSFDIVVKAIFEAVSKQLHEAEQTWNGSMNDFNDEKAELNPIKCFNEINKEYMDYKFLNNSVVPMIYINIKKCVSELASLNPKVKKIENQLVEKLSDAFAYLKNDAVNCAEILRENNVDTECLNTMSKKSGDNFCDKMWGKDGCTVNYRIEYCGSHYMNRLRESLVFLDQGHKNCVDKYYPN